MLAAVLCLLFAARANAQVILPVNTAAGLMSALTTVDQNPGTRYEINITGNIMLAAGTTLPAINTTSPLIINGNNFTVNGGGVQQGLFVYSGTVAINNLAIINAAAVGGSSSAGGVAGGGMGAGGALLVASGGNVTVSNVTLSNNNATGGAGGAAGGEGGGGGGLGGNGGNTCCGSGGGGVGRGADGGNGAFGTPGSAGIVIGAANGGAGTGGSASGGVAGGGGGGNAAAGGGGGVGGGNAPSLVDGGSGGFGGGGGGGTSTGGTGGFGCGGGGSLLTGGAGGYGGGGGNGPTGGTGGFGGGAAGGGFFSAGGGGGAGMGGAIFVQQGGTLTLAGSLSINGNSVTPGLGGCGCAGDGQAFGSGIFMQGNGMLAFAPGSGQAQTISDLIADEKGVIAAGYTPPTGFTPGSWGLILDGPGSLTLSAANQYSGGTNVLSGSLVAGNNGAFGSGMVSLAAGTTLSFVSGTNFTIANNFQISGDPNFAPPVGTTQTLTGVISGSGSLTQDGPGTLVLRNSNSYTGATTISSGTLALAGNGSISASSGVNDNGVFSIAGLTTFNTTINSLSGNGAVALGSNTLGLSNASGTFGGVITGAGGILLLGGTETLTGASTYRGGTFILGGTLAVGNNNALGSGRVEMANGATLAFTESGINLPNAILLGVLAGTINTGTNTDTISGVITGPNDLTKIGSGTLILSANNPYIGPTNVNAGTLDVTGSIANSSLSTVASGATLTGTGTVGSVKINSGGVLLPGAAGAPGTSLTIAGNLAFASGAVYLVQVNPTAATTTNISGTATLSGATVNAVFASGNYVTKSYDILRAVGGINGIFATLTNSSLPAGLADNLSYSGTDVFLNITANLPLNGLTINERNVAVGLDNYFNSGGALPANFLPIFGLTGGALANTLMHLDDEVATGSEVPVFQLMDEFLNLMLDPFVDGRLGSGANHGGGAAMGFAPDAQTELPPDVALAYAGVLKAPPAPPFQQRWTAWAASFGGANSTAGDPAVIGSSNLVAQTFGFAAGMDYHYSPDTVVGFALGGGGTDWGLAGGMGTGRSDAFQTGVYGITRAGPAYLGGALAFANHWITTSRATMGDILNANFDGQSYGGRVEGGYRFAVLPALGVSPYAAVQAQAFHTPNYSETDVTGGGFGLNYAAMNATDTRTELGARFDDPAVVGGIPVLLRGRLAWAHDFVSDPALSAAFQSLPGSNFTVNGAPIPHDSALTTAGAEFFFTPRWTLLVKFEGEFAPGSQTYAGSGTLRYVW